ncbi:hypothetical protein [Halorussus sp. AFM4]|uniref:hypothetical protein n=1 Tax=Halorussus sp. AFM4 TaxID=3421651 RepID=UPI003EBFB26E
MERRELLARFGAVLGALAVGGCLGDGNRPGGGGETTADETTHDGTTTGETTSGGGTALTDSGLEVTDAGCETPSNDASIEFASDRGSVVVTGTVRAPDPCHIAELADASYDPETGTLDVTVAAVRADGTEACAECVAAVSYEATFAFAGGLPATVTVVHDSMGESTTVATAES